MHFGRILSMNKLKGGSKMSGENENDFVDMMLDIC
jgi:hypothetical protein